MVSRPWIGVTGPDRGGAVAWHATRTALRAVGGRAVRLTPSRSFDARHLAGLVLGGGADLSPVAADEPDEPFGETVAETREALSRGTVSLRTVLTAPLTLLLRRLGAVKSHHDLDPGRDLFEATLLEQAWTRGWPVLGICRGAQLMTVRTGGALHDDIGPLLGESPHIRSVLPRVPVTIERDSRLYGITGTERMTVNALHHQSIRTPGDRFRIVARDHRGIVQAVEHTARPFVLGVQWHPEYVPQHPRQRALFRALVDAARH